MAYWLVKSEPGAWSWDDHVKDGVAEWDGIRNHQANNNMKAMKIGDRAFFYHSVDEKRIVGILEVVKEHYPDPTDASGRFGMVDFKALPAGQDAGHPGADQERSAAAGHDPGPPYAPLRVAGHAGGMGSHLRTGRNRGLGPIDIQDAGLAGAPADTDILSVDWAECVSGCLRGRICR